MVNNNAAAVMLGLNTFALIRKSLYLGDSCRNRRIFSDSEVMKLSGAKLVEVGNTTRLMPVIMSAH